MLLRIILESHMLDAPVFMTYNRSPINKHCLWGRISRQPMPLPLSLVATSIVLRNHAKPSRQSARRIGRGLAQRASMLWRKGHYWRRSAPRARNDADHTLLPVAALPAAKVRGVRANDFGGGMQRARGRMSSDVRARAKPASARHLDRHGSGLGKAGARN
jgi:hypothetical protein